ncbi:MAG: Crp/Fnr family transcriptional regulator [Microcoleus sp. PH2017_10_PVI_O_A]|uniref:Crp/Fnr family transcriptional regulator n=1 Tax=unclassified Microcoleus TaxID=2642155 RepID=UPI001E0451F8|nr:MULTISPECIES: Crp/Fnr family transcriptional regulator [unclassified Microcoleus]TAE85900.1 MAG: Crp/Fnr family transcriptional regulator [Oscillatoriales cyanobacterium]MCC3404106.1 Crp/Fnr family transcriptional regulator [Microcoleus sp. PH2017_10_PVI_O_A]MCC3458189.1 Crp/Fnr family transcriptional regulator [Microcoleus sp. PH2017_11_PCY_U_A]MCC3476611.1 Crp/Fnr family transcriptional regulator [Microcoleus sp. PH2017_12_PCY_D_A]MCC3527888.1 Crp/Fnr family transcriptional regulator [Mic
MKATVEQLAQIGIFASLNQAELEQLQEHTAIRTYRQGEVVMYEGDRIPEKLYTLLSGSLRVAKTAAAGKETILRTLFQGDMFAAPALLGNGVAPATVTAETDVQVLTTEREFLLAAIRQNPEIALRILAVFNQRLQQLHETVHGLVSERAIVRLARFIHYFCVEQNTKIVENRVCLEKRFPYYQIARSIGITYEECVRLFKKIKPIVSYSRGGKIIVLDWDKLENLASRDEIN